MGSLKGVSTLKTKREFDRVYKSGRAYHSPCFVIFYRPDEEMRVGFVASKKVGKAVQRNRAKRLLRAVVIPYLERLRCGSYVFVAKPPILECTFSELRRLFEATLRKGSLL